MLKQEILGTRNKVRCIDDFALKKFELTTATIEKKSLCDADDKRKILDDGIHTLPWGHYSLRNLEEQLEQTKNTGEVVPIT